MLVIGDYEFEKVCMIELPEDKNLPQVLQPQARYINPHGLKRHGHGDGPFCYFRIPKRSESGVYAILVSSEVQYIGITRNLTARFNGGYACISPRKCFEGGPQTSCRINNLIYQSISNKNKVVLYFHGVSFSQAKAIENELINAYATKYPKGWNIRGGGIAQNLAKSSIGLNCILDK